MSLIFAGTKHKDSRLHRGWQQERTINIAVGFLESVETRLQEGNGILLGNARPLAGFLTVSGVQCCSSCSHGLAFGSV